MALHTPSTSMPNLTTPQLAWRSKCQTFKALVLIQIKCPQKVQLCQSHRISPDNSRQMNVLMSRHTDAAMKPPAMTVTIASLLSFPQSPFLPFWTLHRQPDHLPEIQMLSVEFLSQAFQVIRVKTLGHSQPPLSGLSFVYLAALVCFLTLG